MAELPAELQKLVEDQAEARLAMNVQGYAKYLTPEAVDSLRASYSGIPPRVNRFDIDAAEELNGEYIVDVRYYARDNPFIVRSRWAKRGDAWMVVHAERLYGEGDMRPGFFSKLVGSILRRLASLRR
jgi:hypothetical protein